MMRFIQNLLSRHMDRDANVKPRVRGLYEDEPDRVADASEETSSSVDAEHGTRGFSEIESDQGRAQNFWPPKEFRKETLSESQQQTPPPAPSFTARQHEGHDQQSDDGDHGADSKHQSPQDSVIAIKNGSLKNVDAGSVGQIRYNPKIYPTTPPDETIQFKDEHKGKNSTDATSGSTHILNDSDGASKKNKKPLSDASSSVLPISPSQKELINTPGRPLIQSPTKGTVQQVINVSIGRIEIRASLPPQEVKVPAFKENRGKMSLDQYLDQQKSASR